MPLNITPIGTNIKLVKPILKQLSETEINQCGNIVIKDIKKKVDLTEMATSVKNSNVVLHNDTKSADLTNIEENAGKVAAEFVTDATTKGLLEAVLKRTVGIPSIEEADKVVQDTLKNQTDTSIVNNIENAWADWKNNYYKNGNISTGDAFKAGINLIPTIGRGICNGVIQTATNLVKDVTSEDGAKTVSNAIHTVSEAVSTVGSSIVNTVKGIGNAIATPFVAIKDAVSGSSNASKTASNAWESIKSVGTGIWNGVKATGRAILDTAASAVTYIGKGIANLVTDPIGTIKNAAIGVWNGIKNFFKSIF